MNIKQRKQFALMYASSMLWHAAISWMPDERLSEADVYFITDELKKISDAISKKHNIFSGQERIIDHILKPQREKQKNSTHRGIEIT